MRRKRIEGRYEVTDDGVVWSGGLPLRPVRGVWVSIGGRRRRVDWLVARAFVPNPEGRPCLAHLNGDVRDSRAENLEWREEPQSWARSGRRASPRPVGAWDRAGDSAGVWGGGHRQSLGEKCVELIHAFLPCRRGRAGPS